MLLLRITFRDGARVPRRSRTSPTKIARHPGHDPSSRIDNTSSRRVRLHRIAPGLHRVVSGVAWQQNARPRDWIRQASMALIRLVPTESIAAPQGRFRSAGTSMEHRACRIGAMHDRMRRPHAEESCEEGYEIREHSHHRPCRPPEPTKRFLAKVALRGDTRSESAGAVWQQRSMKTRRLRKRCIARFPMSRM